MIELLLQADRLLSVDLVDQAESTYQRVADRDPNNAIAVVGLARCALARGKDGDAYALAARALLIDPENDMARRMEARMAEVLTYRGETLPPVAVSPGRSANAARPASAAERVGTAGRAGTASAAAPAGARSVTGTPAPTTSTGRDRSWLDRLRGH